MKAVIICNGEPPSKALIERECKDADYVICADGGAMYAGHVKVDLFVGDFDSYDESKMPADAEILKLDCEKDETDAEVATYMAMQKGADNIVYLAAMGKRLDHTLANIQLLVQCAYKNVSATLKDDKSTIYVISKMTIFRGKPGDLLSIFPIGLNVEIRSLHGLKYPLHNTRLNLSKPRTVSNEFSDNTAIVDIASGWVVITIIPC